MNAASLPAIARWSADPDARALRHAVAIELAEAPGMSGPELRLVGNVIGDGRIAGSSPRGNGNDDLVALGYLAEAAGQLLAGIERAVASCQFYIAAALARQMVEFEYLTWTFETDHENAAVWLNSSAEDRRKMWQPRHLRERSNGHFEGRDYSTHCELGGHPTPNGLHALITTRNDAPGEVILADSVNHTVRVWRTVAGSTPEVTRVDVEALNHTLDRWWSEDGLPEAMADGLTTGGIA